ncbi:TPA: hypothetical protein DCW61_02425 [Candidatus Uhrbacteria bacterium]|nr:hypothetical protein [Candidatus Uhrbacteria bacterium]
MTGISFDANGAGNSITNIENADFTVDTLDFTAFDDTMELDVATSITGTAGEIFSLVRTGTAAATENGMTLTFTAGVGDGSDVYSALNLGVTSADQSASSDKVYALNIANLASADAQGDETAINIGTGWDTGIAFGTNAIDGTYFDVAAMNGAVSMGQPDDSNIPALTVSMHSVSGSIIDADYITETQTGAISAVDIDLTNLTNDNANNLYGIMLNDFTLGDGAGGNLYGIYQQGINWDYGIYADDDVYFVLDATVLGGDITGANGNAIDIGEAVDGTIIFSRDDAASVTLSAADSDANADLVLLGGGTSNVQVKIDADSEFNVTASAAPTADIMTITNTGFSSATDGVDALQITHGVDDATGNVIDITPTFSHGDDVDSAETWTVIDVDAFTATNSIASTNQTAILHGLNFGDLTEAGTDLITSTGIEIGGGWDIGVAFSPGETITGNGTDLTIATGDRLLITTANNGSDDVNITGSVTVTNDLAVTDDFSVEGIVDIGTQDVMADGDTTPSVSGASFFTGSADGETVTAFDDDVAGQIWVIEFTGVTTFDCDNNGTFSPTLQCGNGDLITDAGDSMVWTSDGTNEILLSWMDESDAQTGSDLAEWFPANQDVQAGDVLVAAGSPEHVEKSTGSYQKGLMGIVSTQPGLILGEEGGTFSALVALAGRVPVNVSDENGAIEIGDFLTSSATLPGYAMKATQPGPVIGMAMENFSGGQGQIKVKVENMWYVPTSSLQDASSSTLVSEAETITATDASFSGSVTVGEHLYGSHDMAGRVRMMSGTDHVTVTFTTQYAQLPIITFSSRSNSESAQGAWISDESVTGFTIHRSLTDDQIEFNWIAVGVESAQVTVATDWSEGVSIDVTDMNGPVAPAPVPEATPDPVPEPQPTTSTGDTSSTGAGDGQQAS